MEVLENIKNLIKPVLDKHSVFLVDIVIRGERGSKLVEVFIDNYNGVTADLCADVSRDVSRILNEENIISGNYFLNISSPGLNRPLKFPEQYHKHIGHKIEVEHKDNEELKKIRGELIKADDSEITISDNKNSQIKIKYSNIIKALIKTPW